MATILMPVGPPVSGTSGSFTDAQYGDEIIDITNLTKYVNTSRISGSPTWSQTSLTSGTQTIAGDKTFTGNETFSNTVNFTNSVTMSSALVIAGNTTFRRTPATTQALTLVTDTLVPRQTAAFTTGSNLTLTSAPTIAGGAAGDTTRLLNVGSFNLVISDQGTLASSNLRLTATTITIAPRQSVELSYNATIGNWVQTSNLVAVI